MASTFDKQEADVTIGGKVYTLMGYESEDYLQRVAAYINTRLSEYQKSDSFRRLPIETQHVLELLNIADDFFKAREQLEQTTSDLEKRDKETYDLKHNLVVQMTKMEALEKTFKELQNENSKNERRVIELEAELRGRDHEAETLKSVRSHEAVKHEPVKHETAKHETGKHETAKHEAGKQEADGQETAKREPVKHETVKQMSLKDYEGGKVQSIKEHVDARAQSSKGNTGGTR